ncbi:MAG: 2-oxoglutarate dehydrogenase E1 component [Gemmatimonadetes bacterium]|nr:2-oxoglutarate dehydrogenase E1 component [Gemmatimonadota bacterium]
MSEPLFDQQNAGYAQALYEQYARNPQSVPQEWRDFFAQGAAVARRAGLLVPETLSTNGGSARAEALAPRAAPPQAAGLSEEAVTRRLSAVAKATYFVQAFRDHGHMLARIDPLGGEPPGHPQLDPAFFGTSLEELEEIPATVVLNGGARPDETVAEALRRLRETYCGDIGWEFEHLEDPERVRWLWNQVESGVHTRPLDSGAKVRLLQRLSEVEGFEQFIHRTFLGQKRFSVEGNDMLVPMLDLALEEAARSGGEGAVLGMAHRGRLNVLAHTVGVPYADILREFGGLPSKGGPLAVAGTGDVKYHHGAEGEFSLPDGGGMSVILSPNPSHLEFVNPVVLGMTRSLQFGGEGKDRRQNTMGWVPILIHGDAAFAAQGVVAEALNLGRLAGYTVGGAIHVIVNNQIGFTTTPSDGRSTRYASDLAKGYDFPILHVNADRPEACLAAVRLAMAYRAEYGDDVVIDLVGYRRHGHNEGDEPAYTQPRQYARIAEHPTARVQWAKRLQDEGVIDEAAAQRIEDAVAEHLRGVHDQLKEEPGAQGEDHDPEPARSPAVETALPFEVLQEIDQAALTWPEGFTVHPKLQRSLEKRREAFGLDTPIEWAHAETLAFGSLLRDGTVVRLSGQDSQRGTFSQRHLVLHDVETGEEHCPLTAYGEGRFEVWNSPLSEAAVVGFEYGYSVVTDNDLVLWEAQFGDFVNSAQVAIDQFVSSGREKWDQLVNLTLLLPHGYEGQGPEHSSARLERFLQLCAEGNLRVAYPTTPSQYFHLLRRQAHARPERPLVVMTPKSLLRLPAAATPVRELVEGRFHPVIDDPGADELRESVTRLVLCTGKVYYDIQAHEARPGATSVAVARIEELYPFPAEAVDALVKAYPKLEEVVWTQEEPRNMGALTFIGPRLRAVVPREVPLRYVARPERASPAEGKAVDHAREQKRIVREALGLEGG